MSSKQNLTDPLISVVLPVYNGARFLRAAIDSILRQTYTDFELLIINDGSTDDSGAIIHRYSDPRIRYFEQENRGIGAALRNGCGHARGKFLSRMDDDDISLPQRLEFQVKFMQDHPETVVLSSAVIYIDEDGKPFARSFPYTTHRAIRRKLQTFNPVCHPGVMMRTDAYRRSVGYLDIQPFEDHILWLSLLEHGTFRNLTRPLLQYRILPTSLSRSLPPDQMNRLFLHLRTALRSGRLDEAGVTEYNKLLSEAREKTGRLSRKTSESASVTAFPVSAMQWKLYRILKATGLSGDRTASFLCSMKSCSLT